MTDDAGVLLSNAEKQTGRGGITAPALRRHATATGVSLVAATEVTVACRGPTDGCELRTETGTVNGGTAPLIPYDYVALDAVTVSSVILPLTPKANTLLKVLRYVCEMWSNRH